MDCNEILASKPSKNPKLPTSKRNQLSFLTLHRLPQTSNFSIQQLLTFQRHTTPSPKNHQLPSVLRGPCPRFGPRRSQPGQPIKISVNCIRPPSPEVDSPIWESRWKCLLDMQRRSNCWPYALSLSLGWILGWHQQQSCQIAAPADEGLLQVAGLWSPALHCTLEFGIGWLTSAGWRWK